MAENSEISFADWVAKNGLKYGEPVAILHNGHYTANTKRKPVSLFPGDAIVGNLQTFNWTRYDNHAPENGAVLGLRYPIKVSTEDKSARRYAPVNGRIPFHEYITEGNNGNGVAFVVGREAVAKAIGIKPEQLKSLMADPYKAL
ncbi:MAG: hypothetical protein HY364_03830 [Candidatus Aenigmarchaeota archaeon]|nr:hypothetical protein [Candidatus Aenigmarchaeota archaeon]